MAEREVEEERLLLLLLGQQLVTEKLSRAQQYSHSKQRTGMTSSLDTHKDIIQPGDNGT